MNKQTKGIAFKNFRRFQNFPMLQLGNITYMVGRNNSGKSTMVKALLLITDYLQNQLSDTFLFDNAVLEDANIVTFDRAKCNLNNEPGITFDLKLNNYSISIHISGVEGRTKADVNLLHIYDNIEGYSLKVNYLTEVVKITKKSISDTVQIDSSDELLKIKTEINQLKESLQLIPNKVSKEALRTVDQLNKLIERRNRIAHSLESPIEDDFEYNLEYPLNYQKKKKGSSVSDNSGQKQNLKVREVDVSLNRHIKNLGKMTNIEFLNKQLENAQRELEYAIDKDFSKVLFKNVGKGVFKGELEHLLNKYDHLTFDFKDAEGDKGGIIEVQLIYEENNEQINNIKRTEDNELKETVSTFLYHNSIAYIQILDQRNSKIEYIEEVDDASSDIIELDNSKEELKAWIDKLVLSINRESLHYLGANPSKQSALFYLRDKNNALAQAIHNFYQLTAGEKNNDETRFIKDWMKVFEVGLDFSINMQAGEAYEFKIFEEDFKTAVSLSDKGMGSLQAMTLILKIASLIRLSKKNKKFITVLVEEPELNLHPALQSKLSDFFHYVNKEYKFNFIIETHSEYIVRRSQLLTLENDYLSNQELNPNPFSIFYFHKEDGPYEMEYNSQGKFNRDFGPGFYDEAGSLTLKMIKELRKNQAK